MLLHPLQLYNGSIQTGDTVMLDTIIKPGLLYDWLSQLQSYTAPITTLPDVTGLDIVANLPIPDHREIHEILQQDALTGFSGPYCDNIDKGIKNYLSYLKSSKTKIVLPKHIQSPVYSQHGMTLRKRLLRVLHSNISLLYDT